MQNETVEVNDVLQSAVAMSFGEKLTNYLGNIIVPLLTSSGNGY